MHQKLKIVVILLILTFCRSQQDNAIQPEIIGFEPEPIKIDNQIPAQRTPATFNQEQLIEIKQEGTYHQQLNQQLPAWIRQQLDIIQTVVQLPITQTFSFIIKSQEQVLFKWDPSKQKQLKLIVDVFYVSNEGDLQVIQDAEQTQYVQIMARNPNSAFFGLLGKVYRSKIMTVDFDTDYKQLKFANKNSETVLIQIDVEKLSLVVQKGVPDDLLTTSRTKMSSILQQSQTTQIKRQHVYKWQWGYLDNQKNHQMHLLGLTGIELFAIISTAIIQMYCLKGLLDNRAVV